MSRENEDLSLRDSRLFMDIISMKYIDSEDVDRFGFVTVKVEYSSQDLRFIDVEYSDPYIMKHVEEHPRVLRKIDSYLRNRILQEQTINSNQ
jgi:hypothetical protein